MAVLCFAGARDYLALNAALWQAVTRFQDSGFSVRQLDAGYVVNGWMQYAHPDNAPRNSAGELVVPWVTTRDRLRYAISSTRLKDYTVLEEIPFRRWIAPDGSVYLLESMAAPTAK
jgi:hypothetical protein